MTEELQWRGEWKLLGSQFESLKGTVKTAQVRTCIWVVEVGTERKKTARRGKEEMSSIRRGREGKGMDSGLIGRTWIHILVLSLL